MMYEQQLFGEVSRIGAISFVEMDNMSSGPIYFDNSWSTSRQHNSVQDPRLGLPVLYIN